MVVFIVLGRLSKSIVASKTIPFISSERITKAYLFCQKEGFPIEKAEYITLPNWIVNLKPYIVGRIIRIIYEPVQLFIYTIKLKPYLINGVLAIPKGLNSTIVGLLTRTPIMVSLIGGVWREAINTKMWIWEKFVLWMLCKCSVVTTTGSNVTKQIIAKGVSAKKIFTFTGSVDVNRFKFDEKIQKDIDVIFVGHFTALKGPDRVISIVKRLLEDGIKVKAVLLGRGELFEFVKRSIEDLKLNDYVILTGYVEHPEICFQRSKCIVIPSRSEGLPTCMMEAMACGCVPVASNVGNITDAVIHSETGLVVQDYLDLDMFTEHIKKLLIDEEFRLELADKGIKFFLDHYTPSKQSEIVDDIVDYLQVSNTIN